MLGDSRLFVPEQGCRLHYVLGVGVEEAPVEDALQLGESLLDRGLDAMLRPEAYEAGVGMHVGMKDRRIKVNLYGHAGIVPRKNDAETMSTPDRIVWIGWIDGSFGQGGKAGDLEGERVGVTHEPQPAGVGLLQGFEEEPFVVDPACAHNHETTFVSAEC